jgi:chromosome segregation ATPase
MAKGNKKNYQTTINEQEISHQDVTGNDVPKVNWERAEVIDDLEAKVEALSKRIIELEGTLALSDSLLKQETDSLMDRTQEVVELEKKNRDLQRLLDRQTKNTLDYLQEVDKLQRRLNRVPTWVKKFFSC